MPQMSPMNWIIMFLIFIFLVLIVMNKIYFLMNKESKTTKKTHLNSQMDIKWLW